MLVKLVMLGLLALTAVGCTNMRAQSERVPAQTGDISDNLSFIKLNGPIKVHVTDAPRGWEGMIATVEGTITDLSSNLNRDEVNAQAAKGIHVFALSNTNVQLRSCKNATIKISAKKQPELGGIYQVLELNCAD